MKTKFLHFLAKIYSICGLILTAILLIVIVITRDSLPNVYSVMGDVIGVFFALSVFCFFLYKLFNE